MNERIKELIFETDEWLESNAQSDRWEREIKFAQLIIRECVAQMISFYKFDPHTGKLPDYQYNACIDDQVAILLEHFGVEE
jgi:hypothetical protein